MALLIGKWESPAHAGQRDQYTLFFQNLQRQSLVLNPYVQQLVDLLGISDDPGTSPQVPEPLTHVPFC
jgi:hypothetical protein